MSQNPVMEAVRSELPFYPGVQMDATDKGGNHRKIYFHRNGSSRFLVVPRSPSDWRAPKNAVRELRKLMVDLGAERSGEVVPITRVGKTKKRGKAATISLNQRDLVVHIGAASKLIRRFRDENEKAVAHWSVELRPSVDLTAPPMIVLRKVEASPGKHHGIVSGFKVPGGSWRLAIARSMVPALAKLPEFRGTGVRLYEDTGNELVFQLPAGTIPTGFRKRDEAPAPLPSQAWAERAEAKLAKIEAEEGQPVEAPTATPAAPAAVDIGDRPLVLQMPKQTVSIEAAIAVLNKAKRRLGDNLRFQIVEGGYLTATHRIGH